MDLELTDAVVLVTGGSSGLGAAVAARLAREGARVAICGRDEERLAATQRRLQDAGGDVLAVRADVTDQADCERLVNETVGRWGRLDGLVNNAGGAASAPFESVSDADFGADFELKVLPAARLTRLAAPHLRASPHAAVVNTLAHLAKTPEPGTLPTSVSRSAGMALTKALSHDLAPAVRVNAVLVGLIGPSGGWTRLSEQTGRPVDELMVEMAERKGIPLGRIGRTEEFADLVTYLLSPRASYVTGSAVNVDGGLCAVV